MVSVQMALRFMINQRKPSSTPTPLKQELKITITSLLFDHIYEFKFLFSLFTCLSLFKEGITPAADFLSIGGHRQW